MRWPRRPIPVPRPQAYFNIGAVLTNAGKADDAIAAFDKCIAADPTRAEAYYQKGVNLLGKATLQGDKTVARAGHCRGLPEVPGIAPTGPNAQSAKDLLASIGSKVETSFGTKKKPPKSSYFRIQPYAEGRLKPSRPLCVWRRRRLLRSMDLLSFAHGLGRGTVNYLSFLPILWCVRFPRCEDEWQHQQLLQFRLR